MKLNPAQIKEARLSMGLSQTEFGERIGVKLRTVQSWESGDRNISTSADVVLKDLIAKHAQSGKESTQEYEQNANGNKFYPLPSGKYKIEVKKVPVKAFGSYITDFQNVEFFGELEEVSFTVEHLGRGNYLSFDVEGDSMNGGGIYDTPEGAEILGRELGRHHWKDGFKESKYGWIIVHKKTLLFKDIVDYDNETGDIVCSSRSGLPNHGKFKINLNDVRQIFKVIKRTF